MGRRVWMSKQDVDETVKTVGAAYRILKRVPAPLRAAVNAAIKQYRSGLVYYFYERLAQECPDALRFFDAPENGGKTNVRT